MKEPLDVVIVGAGPIGLACGIEAQKAGVSYLIIDKGCLTNSLYRYPTNMTFFSTAERLEIGEVPFVSHLPKPNRAEALEYYRRVAEHWNLHIQLYTELREIEESKEGYRVLTPSGVYETKAIIVATGFYDLPNKINVEGEELSKVNHYYKDPHLYFKQKVAVIGASNSAVDAALETYRKGAEVTMIIKGNQISDHVKYWVRPDIDNRIKEGSIKAYFNSTVTKIMEKELSVSTPDGTITLGNDFVLAMTGYVPDFSLLEKVGILSADDDNRTPQFHPETMETNKKNIYLAGVICGGLSTHTWFIENSRKHAPIIIQDLIRKKGFAR